MSGGGGGGSYDDQWIKDWQKNAEGREVDYQNINTTQSLSLIHI